MLRKLTTWAIKFCTQHNIEIDLKFNDHRDVEWIRMECVCVCVCVCARARVCGLLDLITVIYENLLSRVFGKRDLILCLLTLISLVGSP